MCPRLRLPCTCRSWNICVQHVQRPPRPINPLRSSTSPSIYPRSRRTAVGSEPLSCRTNRPLQIRMGQTLTSPFIAAAPSPPPSSPPPTYARFACHRSFLTPVFFFFWGSGVGKMYHVDACPCLPPSPYRTLARCRRRHATGQSTQGYTRAVGHATRVDSLLR